MATTTTSFGAGATNNYGFVVVAPPDPQALRDQIVAAGLPEPTLIRVDGGSVTVGFGESLTDVQAGDLGNIIAAYGIAPPAAYARNVRVETTEAGHLVRVDFYADYDGEGGFTGLAATEKYAWSGPRLLSKTTTEYDSAGLPVSTTTEVYATTSDGRRVVKTK